MATSKTRIKNRGGKLYLNEWPLFTESPARLLESIVTLRASPRAELIVTPNVDQSINLESNEVLRHAFQIAALRIVDGMPLVMIARLLGLKDVHRNTGADLIDLVGSSSKFTGWTVAVTGGRDEVLFKAVNNLKLRNRAINYVAVPFPNVQHVSEESVQAVVGSLNRARPDLVFICTGSPKQENFFVEWRDHLPPAVYVGAGAAVDFAAGELSRAPVLMQNVGLEWMFRLINEPARLSHRYLIKGMRILPIIFSSLFSKRIF